MNKTECPKCDEKGYCLACDGYGQIAGEECPDCSGRGDCLECDGYGFLDGEENELESR